MTRECRRVLKPSGSMWVNLGDSYAGSGGYNNSAIGAVGRGPESYKRNRRGISSDGNEAQWTEADAAWLAGVIDSDGSISIRQFSTGEGRSDSFVGWVRIGQMRPEVVRRAHEVTGVGRVYQDKRGVWNWHATSQMASYVLRRIWPWLYIKRRQALAVVELCRHIADVGASGGKTLSHNDIAYRSSIRQAVHDWNKDRPNDWEPPALGRPTFDAIKPRAKSLHGLPWRYAIGCIDDLDLILRAEVIWNKPNSLPESVTDRVRRSHEQWFMFTKEPRYFAAVDEVREPAATLDPSNPSFRANGKSNKRVKGVATPPGQGEQSLALPAASRAATNPLGKLPGSVWTIPSEPLKVPDWLGVDHFAAYPQEWPRRIILGWSPRAVCGDCGFLLGSSYDYGMLGVRGADHGRPREGQVLADASAQDQQVLRQDVCGEAQRQEPRLDEVPATDDPRLRGGVEAGSSDGTEERLSDGASAGDGGIPRTDAGAERGRPPHQRGQDRQQDREPRTAGEGGPRQAAKAAAKAVPVSPLRRSDPDVRDAQSCPHCGGGRLGRPVVLDIFGGTGTTAMVARALGRYPVHLDLSADYLKLARWRIYESGHAVKSQDRTWREQARLL